MLPGMMSRQKFTRKRYPTSYDHGNVSPDYSQTPGSLDFYGSIQPGSGTTDRVNRDGAEIVYTIFSHPNTDINHLDRVAMPDGEYFVNGAPQRWMTGILDHTVIQLSRWIG